MRVYLLRNSIEKMKNAKERLRAMVSAKKVSAMLDACEETLREIKEATKDNKRVQHLTDKLHSQIHHLTIGCSLEDELATQKK